METTAAGREYWQDVLRVGGATALPRWTRTPVAGVGTHGVEVPDDVVAGLDRLAGELGVPLEALVLAAHATVLSALSGEADVVTGVVTDGQTLPCRLGTAPATWRELVHETAQVRALLVEHGGVAIDELRRQLGVAGPTFETVLAVGGEAELTERAVVAVQVSAAADRLDLRYRTDALDDDAASRIAGYHVTALTLMAADPEAEHHRQTLLSAAELSLQIDGLAGPERQLPDRRLHELFEQRAAAHPEAIAAV
jgi:non-ribosomal peptide synthetase component F